MAPQEYKKGEQTAFTSGSSEEETEAVKGAAGEMKEKGEMKKEEWKERFGEKARSKVSEQKSKAAGELKTTAEVLRKASKDFRERDKSLLARYAEKAAERTEHLSDYLHEKNMDEFIEDAEDFIRRQPLIAMGGAFLAGTVLARFLKASGHKEE